LSYDADSTPEVIAGGVSGSVTGAGAAGGVAIGAGFGFGAATLTGFGFGFGAIAFFFGAALTTFLTAFALTFFFGADFAFPLSGFFFSALFLAFAIGRFFDLLFFAMVTLLLEIVRTRSESSLEKVCCHLCVALESVVMIA
jgi:hypothetical protein